VSLESWVDNERTSSWIHGSNQLGVLDVLKSKLTLVIPMLIVSVLSQQSNGVLGIIWISLWHVHVINEVDELVLSNWSEGLTSFLLELLLKIHLEEVGVSIEVEVDNLLEILVTLADKLVKETFDDLGLTASSESNKNWAVVDLDELSHQVLS